MHPEITILLRQLKMISDPTKFRIMTLMCSRQGFATYQVSEITGLSESLCGHHLGDLCSVGLLNAHKAGRYKTYIINETNLQTFQSTLTLVLKGEQEEPDADSGTTSSGPQGDVTTTDSDSGPSGNRQDHLDDDPRGSFTDPND